MIRNLTGLAVSTYFCSMDQSLRLALITETVTGRGPIQLQRAYQKIDPGAPHGDRIAKLIDELKAFGDASIPDRLERDKIKTLTILDEEYPLQLRNLSEPPLVLFYCGELQNLHRAAIAVVGSRTCTAYGQQTARWIAGELARCGFVITSGLALGIDAEAHAAALEVGGRTVAVLGSGLDVIYPKSHINLARRIAHEDGTVITEFPPGTSPRGFHFPIRNRIISGLCHATVVVEAATRSGSLVTARHCLEQGRELFGVPGPVQNRTSAGPHKLIENGEAHLLRSLSYLLECLQPLVGDALAHQRRLVATIEDPVAVAIYEKLDAFEPTPLDLLASGLDAEVGTVLAALVTLETMGLVTQKPGQLFLRNPLKQVQGVHSNG